jgi:hypothetical protein
MGTNNNLGITSGVILRGDADKYDVSISRRGQWCRLIHSSICPCLTQGHPDIYCTLCNGKGYLSTMQNETQILEENSPHYFGTQVRPFNTPITKVKSVQKWKHPSQGGNEFYSVSSFTNTEITLTDNGILPKKYEPIKVTYSYSNYNRIISENSIHDGTSYKLTTIATSISTMGDTSNPLDITGDIVKVISIINVTKSITYTIKSFSKKYIWIDDVGGTVAAPLITDILAVTYDYVAPIKLVVTNVEANNALLKFSEDIKVGDVQVTLPGNIFVNRGDIITPLSTISRNNVTVVRGVGIIDELPGFDITEVIGNIVDINGVVYGPTLFEIQNYNNLVWLTSTRPAQGIKYTVSYLYRPSYMIYTQQDRTTNLENKRYPHKVHARFLNKFNWHDLTGEIHNE